MRLLPNLSYAVTSMTSSSSSSSLPVAEKPPFRPRKFQSRKRIERSASERPRAARVVRSDGIDRGCDGPSALARWSAGRENEADTTSRRQGLIKASLDPDPTTNPSATDPDALL